MSIDTHTLIWLFPIAFMFHDFEEIIFWELWLKKHGAEVRQRVPSFLQKQVSTITEKSTAETSFSILLIFSLTVLAAFFAAEYQRYGFFLLASGAFFLHGFMHLGQAIILHKYVPATITSVLVIIPYGLVLYGQLIAEQVIDIPGLLIYSLLGMVLIVPLILTMHKVGEYLYGKMVKLLIG
ncbi:MAG TPA: HXXEE domain-containing protein [Anaerolineales bacterium]|nr:HXXEE domain-containing protein [Anaerolineales bacterium]